MKVTIEGFRGKDWPLVLDGVEEFVFFGTVLELGALPRNFQTIHGNLDRLIGQGTRVLHAMERMADNADTRKPEPDRLRPE